MPAWSTRNAVEAIEATLRTTEPEKFTAPVSKGGCVSVILLLLLPAAVLVLLGRGKNIMYCDDPATLRVHRLLAAGILAFLSVLAVQFQACASPGFLGRYFKPESQLKSVEVYHVNSSTLVRAALNFSTLMSTERSDDYVRFNRPGSAVRDLYEALNGTVILDGTCGSFDMRWAVVMTYRDQTREAVGFGPFYQCVEVLSTGERLAVSPALFEYVLRTFPFMR